MPVTREKSDWQRILLLPPTSRDAIVCEEILNTHGLETVVCRDIAQACQEIEAGAGLLFIAEESLESDQNREVEDSLRRQAPWSDFPLLVLTLQNGMASDSLQRLMRSANVTLISRPVDIDLFVNAVQSRLRDRRRQYTVHRLLDSSTANADAAMVVSNDFIANMSHEIRTPMTAVLGYSKLLTETETDPEKLRYLQTIERNGSLLLEIVNDILDYSKIEAGRIQIRRERFETDQLVAEISAIVRVWAVEKQLDFETRFLGTLPRHIESDPKRLKQILLNLLGNAVKFTESGRVDFEIRYVNGALAFDVIDTGIGITAAQQERLFHPFSQGDAAANRQYGGTGLGLAISYRLARMLGGDIVVDSNIGQGTRMTCLVDTGRVSSTDLFTPSSQLFYDRSKNSSTPEIRLNLRVLIADDRRDIRLLAGHFLRRAGAEVEYAEDGLNATQIIQSSLDTDSPFDLVLMDMQMPRMDGYHAAEALRKMGFSNPIIALTADAMHGDMDRCLSSGCNSYLSKPIDADELLKVIASYSKKLPDDLASS